MTQFDTIGRPTAVWSYAGVAAPSACNDTSAATGHTLTAYNSPQFGSPLRMKDTVTDQAGHSRDLYHDGEGRLTSVVEDPGGLSYTTGYDYNALDNLISVVQGAQSRSFVYDSLQRLTRSLHPEMNPAGTGPALAASYTYTNDGLPLTRTDGNGVTTSYVYDALNRLTGETHSGSGSALSATITRCYDGLVASAAGTCAMPGGFTIPYAAGRLTATRSDLSTPAVSSTTTYKAYDQLGRVLTSEQATSGSGPYDFQYEYDLAGGLTGFTNVTSGRKVSTIYNNLDQPTDVSGQIGAGTPTAYVQGALYAPHGAMSQAAMNPGSHSWTDAWGYNSLLQVSSTSSANGFGLGYTYFNNNNVASQTITRPGKSWTQTYTYDNVNRLKTAVETGQSNDWSQTYDYTATGNRYVSASPNLPLGTFTATSSSQFDGGNHLAISGVVHDNAGNQTQMGSGLTMAYDADGHMQSSTLNGLTTYYVYDADGHRVMKTAGSASTTYVYDAFGQLAMEAGGTEAPPCTTCFLTVDALGSTRQMTDAATGGAVSNHDYLPFGEELTGVAARTGPGWGVNDITLKFTGKERDADTVSSGNTAGLDYFGARYMSGVQGRFTSPDPHTGTLLHALNPQRWNMYTYGVNNPLSYVDPDGRDAIAVNFGSLAVGMGHWAIISVNRDGSATFSEFGPRGGGKPVYPGQYTSYSLDTKITAPTPEVLAAVQRELAQREGQSQGSISLAYYKTSDAETASLNAYIQAAIRAQANDKAPFYLVGVNDCRDYCLTGLHTAGITTSHYANLNLAPNFLFQFLESTANATFPSQPKKKEKVDTTICYAGQLGCTMEEEQK